MDLETVRARLVADASQFVSEFERAGGALGGAGGNGKSGGLAAAAIGANHGVGMLKRGLEVLAFQATGTTGPIGHISAGLLQFGGGSGAVIAIAGAIGAVAIAIRMLTAEARADASALKEMDAALESIGTHGRIQSIRDQIAALEAEQQKTGVGATLSRGIKALLGPLLGGASFAEQQEAIKRKIAELRTTLGQLTTQFASPFQTTLAISRQALLESGIAMENMSERTGIATEAIRVVRLEHEHYTASMAKEIAANERIAATNNAIVGATREVNAAFAEAFIRFNDFGKGADAVQEEVDRLKLSISGLPDDMAARLAGVQRQTREMMRGVADMETLRQIGIDAGKQLVMGFAEGMASMQDFLKFIWGELMNFMLGNIFGRIFGAIGGTALGLGTGSVSLGGPGGGPVRSVVAPTPSINFNMSGMPGATNPLAAARDAQWQVFLRESVLVAASQGFRSR